MNIYGNLVTGIEKNRGIEVVDRVADVTLSARHL